MVIQKGKHKVVCGDIMLNAYEQVMQGEKADILYSDPPWGSGNLKYWDTMNVKMNNVQSRDIGWETFVNKFAEIVNNYTHEQSQVFIEMGMKFYDKVVEVFEQKTNFKLAQRFDTVYSNKLPMIVLYFTDKNPYMYDVATINGTTADKTVNNILEPIAKENLVVFDPCMGYGRTLRISEKYNMSFRGSELNQARIDRAIKFLEDKCT